MPEERRATPPESAFLKAVKIHLSQFAVAFCEFIRIVCCAWRALSNNSIPQTQLSSDFARRVGLNYKKERNVANSDPNEISLVNKLKLGSLALQVTFDLRVWH
jgi:hypothetical protein